jgi:methionine biosynthesis protein MetW
VYDSLNETVLAAVPLSGKRILDVGCGTGRLGKQLKERQSCHVTGITNAGEEARAARTWLDEVHEIDLEQFAGLGEGKGFDVLVLSHILEHIRSPETLLSSILRYAVPRATVVVALPNVLMWKQRLEFLRGRFRYAESGIMDRTHVHFFDRAGALLMIRESGLAMERSETTGGWPGSRLLGPMKSTLDRLAVNISPGLFGGEFVFVCRYGKGGSPIG